MVDRDRAVFHIESTILWLHIEWGALLQQNGWLIYYFYIYYGFYVQFN